MRGKFQLAICISPVLYVRVVHRTEKEEADAVQVQQSAERNRRKAPETVFRSGPRPQVTGKGNGTAQRQSTSAVLPRGTLASSLPACRLTRASRRGARVGSGTTRGIGPRATGNCTRLRPGPPPVTVDSKSSPPLFTLL